MRLAPLLLAPLMAAAPAAAEPVDLELVLLADSSGSIDDSEIRFQRQNYAAALRDPEILSAIRVGGYLGKIAVTFIEWGDLFHQDVVVPWTIIDGSESAAAFEAALLAAPRRAVGRNAIGAALDAARHAILSNGHEGERRVIDLSADSANSWSGPSIAEARDAALAAGITINGLAVSCRECSGRPVTYDLEEAFARTIIGGPASFVITAHGRTSFAEAVRRKLLLEIAGSTPDEAPAPRLAERR
jgi:hypothetical protein